MNNKKEKIIQYRDYLIFKMNNIRCADKYDNECLYELKEALYNYNITGGDDDLNYLESFIPKIEKYMKLYKGVSKNTYFEFIINKQNI